MLAVQATPRKNEQATSSKKPQTPKRSMGLTNLQHHKGLDLTTATFDTMLYSDGFNTSLTARYRLADAGCATALRGLLRHKIRVAKHKHLAYTPNLEKTSSNRRFILFRPHIPRNHYHSPLISRSVHWHQVRITYCSPPYCAHSIELEAPIAQCYAFLPNKFRSFTTMSPI